MVRWDRRFGVGFIDVMDCGRDERCCVSTKNWKLEVEEEGDEFIYTKSFKHDFGRGENMLTPSELVIQR